MQKTVLKNGMDRISEFSDSEWALLEPYWQKKEYRAGDKIIQKGSIERYFYFIESGVTRYFQLQEEGQEVSIGFAYTGDFAGAYDSFLSQFPAEYDIECLGALKSFRISFEDLEQLYGQIPALERWGRKFNEERLIQMARRQFEVRSYSAEEKVRRLVQQSPHILTLVPQKYLASYLGITPETFSRNIKKIRKTTL